MKIVTSILFSFLSMVFVPIVAHAETHHITFPLQIISQFRDDFGEPRAGHAHKGIDIIVPKMTPIISVSDGIVHYLPQSEPSWGYEISIASDDGYTYKYLHINNDTPGTDDNAGGVANAYAPGLTEGARVARGQHIGWVGDSGNAEDVGAHLHFEMYSPSGLINPYESLLSAYVSFLSSASTTLMAPEPLVSKFIFTKRLVLGSEGEEVKELQKRLRSLGFFTHPSNTGYFGSATKRALVAFQKAKGIDPIGILGPKTRATLNEG